MVIAFIECLDCGKKVERTSNGQKRCFDCAKKHDTHRKCEHNRRLNQCKDCGGNQICEHNRRLNGCRDCGGSQICQHNRERSRCKDCGGSQICQHNRLRSHCKECGGSQICQHNRRRNECKDCGGASICPHNRQRITCKDCGGSQICQHNRLRSHCKECGGSQICQHNRQRNTCKDCGGLIAIAKTKFSSAKRRAKKDNLPFDITVEDVLELFGDGICPVLGTTYTFHQGEKTDTSAALDKFIPKIGYRRRNCFVISQLANTIKSNATTYQVGRVYEWMLEQEYKIDPNFSNPFSHLKLITDLQRSVHELKQRNQELEAALSEQPMENK